MISKKKLGKKIKKLRTLSNLNQMEFSQILGISQGYISKVESGVSYPSLKALYMINKCFYISTDNLLDEKKDVELNERAKTKSA